MDMVTHNAAMSGSTMSDYEKQAALCKILGTDPNTIAQLPELMKLLHALKGKCSTLENNNATLLQRCTTLEQKCADLSFYASLTCCPANMLYSQPTMDSYSDEDRIEFDQIITGLGGDFVDAFPVPPGKKIMLATKKRPGYCPGKIAADFSLAGGGNNYLDLGLQWLLSPDDTKPLDGGRTIGSRFAGNDFLDKDGRQKDRPFPTYRNRIVCVGSLERLYVVLDHRGGANNVDSAQIRIFHQNDAWYAACQSDGNCSTPIVNPSRPPV